MTRNKTLDMLYVGFPIAALQGAEAETNKRALQAFLTGRHDWRADDQPYRCDVDHVAVVSQPVGAMFDFLLTDQGEMLPEKKLLFKKEIGILGIGMNTVDLLVVANGAAVPARTAGANLGVRRLLDLTNPEGLYTLAERDDQLRAGTLDLSQALPVWGREVTGLIEKKWEQQFRRFAAIVVVGGGAILLRETLLKRFNGKAWIPEDPVFSTARGLYKYALMKQAKAGAAAEVLAFDAGFGNIKLYATGAKLTYKQLSYRFGELAFSHRDSNSR